ncbi:MAG: hypothetical protein ACRDK2_02960 [Solirubrobacteraceae bacterium]
MPGSGPESTRGTSGSRTDGESLRCESVAGWLSAGWGTDADCEGATTGGTPCETTDPEPTPGETGLGGDCDTDADCDGTTTGGTPCETTDPEPTPGETGLGGDWAGGLGGEVVGGWV